MLPLYEMLAKAQNGQGLDLLARQFDLNRQQAELAAEALLPAFSQGLKRNAGTPTDLGSFLAALSTGQHAKYFEDAARAFSQQGVAEGNGILGHLFGSKEVSRAVAAQAAQATGIAESTLRQMLPAMAAMLMGGMFKQSTGQLGQAQAADNPLVAIMQQMMGQFGAAPPRPEAPQPDLNQFGNPFGQMLEGMFGRPAADGGRAGGQAEGERAASPFAGTPWGAMLDQFSGAAGKAEQASAAPGRGGRGIADDLFGGMFEAGAKTRDEYGKAMESIFDQYLKGMSPPER